LFELKIKSNNS